MLCPHYWLLGLLVAIATAENPFPQEPTSLADVNSEFALELYKALHKDHPENIFFSPFSISTCLAMTYLGARNDTAQQIRQVLRFNKSNQTDFHDRFRDLLAQLHHSDRPYILKTANRLFGQNSFTFVQKFLDETSRHYGADLAPVDFHGDTEGARQTINSWVEEQTDNKIQDIMAPGSVSPETLLVLVNAIYFKGKWESQFYSSDTMLRPFHVSPEEEVQVPMMYQDGIFKLGRDDDLNCSTSTQLYLRDALQGKALKYGGSLTRRNRRTEHHRRCFESGRNFRLSEKLSEMGMPDLFGTDADLSGMTGSRDLHVDALVHKAFVEVNEKGTEAAAATAGIIVLGGPAHEFAADHPFLFFIKDNETNSILFMGRLVRPEGTTTAKDEL
uniref:Serpin domain-containing protein n=1 Tax=Branchiostoma floridae TaxID=7739 RepID=C3ZCF8_BRAFL|eukprot:XP_002593777.1 hypothetical protein BRAFLDRAFT_62047 [Branchiostoma floridae]